MNDHHTLPPIGTVEVLIKDQYGTTVYHPHNMEAKHFAAIAGTKTLTLHTLKHILALGFEATYVRPPTPTLTTAALTAATP